MHSLLLSEGHHIGQIFRGINGRLQLQYYKQGIRFGTRNLLHGSYSVHLIKINSNGRLISLIPRVLQRVTRGFEAFLALRVWPGRFTTRTRLHDIIYILFHAQAIWYHFHPLHLHLQRSLSFSCSPSTVIIPGKGREQGGSFGEGRPWSRIFLPRRLSGMPGKN